jgi:hypothetical protein
MQQRGIYTIAVERFSCMHSRRPLARRPSNISHARRINFPQCRNSQRNTIIIRSNQAIYLSIITLRAGPVLLWAGARRSATAAVLPRSAWSSLRARLSAPAMLSRVAWASVVVARASVGGDTPAHTLSPCTRAESVHHHV